MVPHQPPTRRPPNALLALLLLLPLLAACGGAAATNAPAAMVPTRAPARAETAPMEAAAAPTAAAIAASAAPARSAGDTASESAGAVAPAVDAPAAAIGGPPAPPMPAAPPAAEIAAQPTPPAPPIAANQQQQPALRAGEVDDNADFNAYSSYLQNYNGPSARQTDISERYILTVTNDQQQPVLDARVRLFDGQNAIFEGLTTAGGKTIVFPRALGISDNTSELRVLIDKGNSTIAGTLKRSAASPTSFVLPGAQALPQTPRLDVLFLLDATGSMGDEIGQIQQTIVSIAARIDQIQPRPELRFGLVAYRDRGDDYVTQVDDFTSDVASFQQLLLRTQAGGGGDNPESMNAGLHDAINKVTWAEDAVRLTFLVADAPPHLDYAQDYDYLKESQSAVAKGIKVYTIAASNTDDQAEYVMRQISQQTLAHFIFLTYQAGESSGTPGDTTTHQVDPQSFSVERLDDLVVQVIQRELAQAQGAA